MNKALLSICMIILLQTSCSQKPSGINLSFKPIDTCRYYYFLNSNPLLLNIGVSCKYQIQNDSVFTKYEVQKIDYRDGSSSEREISQDFQRYVNSTFEYVYNTRGQKIENAATLNFINADHLVLSYPGTEIKTGDKWQDKITAKPDMIFDSIIRKFTCKEITDKETTINVHMKFIESPGNRSGDVNFSKTMIGYYIVTNSTGAIKSALLEISGFNGFSNSNGKLEIKRVDE